MGLIVSMIVTAAIPPGNDQHTTYNMLMPYECSSTTLHLDSGTPVTLYLLLPDSMLTRTNDLYGISYTPCALKGVICN